MEKSLTMAFLFSLGTRKGIFFFFIVISKYWSVCVLSNFVEYVIVNKVKNVGWKQLREYLFIKTTRHNIDGWVRDVNVLMRDDSTHGESFSVSSGHW